MAGKRNFSRGADRGNKISPDKPKGLRGAHFGAAGPVTHSAGFTTPDPDPTNSPIALAYAKYAIQQRDAGKKPKPPRQWAKSANAKARKPRQTRKPQKSAKLIAHQQAPYSS